MAQQGFNINTFLAHVDENSILKTNKFLCRFPLPVGLRGDPAFQPFFNETSRNLELWCDSAGLPPVILAEHPVLRYGYGAIERKPFSQQVETANFSFYGDGKGSIWNFFYEWTRLILNHNQGNSINQEQNAVSGFTMAPYELSYKYEYVSDVNIIAFNDAGEEAIKVILREAYPLFLAGSPLGWGEKGIMRHMVTMSFQSWNVDRTVG
jgi:hypothetical protein